jgi:hypothetical protein
LKGKVVIAILEFGRKKKGAKSTKIRQFPPELRQPAPSLFVVLGETGRTYHPINACDPHFPATVIGGIGEQDEAGGGSRRAVTRHE